MIAEHYLGPGDPRYFRHGMEDTFPPSLGPGDYTRDFFDQGLAEWEGVDPGGPEPPQPRALVDYLLVFGRGPA